MFRDYEQVATFINKLEKFTNAAIVNHNSPHPQDALHLNRTREELESFIMMVAGISAAEPVRDTSAKSGGQIALLCPECNSEMRARVNRSNGEKFYGCSKYPNCKGTRDSEGLSKQERFEQKYVKEQVEQASGFSFNKGPRKPSTEVAPPVETAWTNPHKTSFNPFDK
ncbi:MAG: topoisomerase DNA-binding C4 zinc finger domain-containing protein [Paenisporosarcina sp.]